MHAVGGQARRRHRVLRDRHRPCHDVDLRSGESHATHRDPRRAPCLSRITVKRASSDRDAYSRFSPKYDRDVVGVVLRDLDVAGPAEHRDAVLLLGPGVEPHAGVAQLARGVLERGEQRPAGAARARAGHDVHPLDLADAVLVETAQAADRDRPLALPADEERAVGRDHLVGLRHRAGLGGAAGVLRVEQLVELVHELAAGRLVGAAGAEHDRHGAIVAHRHGTRLGRPLHHRRRPARGRAAATAAEAAEPERKRGFFRKLRQNLSKTREALGAEIQATLLEGDVDEETWERLEEALIMADVGAATTARVVGELEAQAAGGDIVGGEALSAKLAEMLAEIARTGSDRIDVRATPTVIMAVGVNGTGKTTTIGKLAWHLQRELGLKVVLGAGDTFRAAAVEQLAGWAERAGCEIVRGTEGVGPRRGRLRGGQAGPRARRRRRHHRHRRAPAHAGQPHGRAHEGAPRHRQAARRARRTRRCSPSTRRPARTACARPSSSPRRSRSTASC